MTPLRPLAAASILAGGALHTWLAFDRYGSADLISVFFVNGAASALVAAVLLLGRGPLAPLAGLGISTVSLLALAMSRTGDGVLGFRGRGLDPAPEVLVTAAAEIAATLLLSLEIHRDRHALLRTLRAATRRSPAATTS